MSSLSLRKMPGATVIARELKCPEYSMKGHLQNTDRIRNIFFHVFGRLRDHIHADQTSEREIVQEMQ